MHPPKTKKKNLSSNTNQTEHVQSVSTRYVLSGRRGGLEKSGSNSNLYTMQRINPLGSTVSIQ
ncbi:unnamed protein product [Staurois parvus]|uniref:Uncharacterized protein n=1 Tax=Staurois parvus TaxID=386267 RepID=A0ABN9H1A0_9NEOB|nr:unnamed protein product [Staurois parvus]